MNNKYTIQILVYSLISLSSCNSNSSKTSTINEQERLLSEFDASFEKIITINSDQSEVIHISKDSIDWNKELFFLSYLDQLSPTKYDVINTYRKDSTISKTSYIPKDSKTEIKKLEIDFGKQSTIYHLQVSKDNYLQTSQKNLEIIFKNYGDQKIFQSYKLIGHQKTSTTDSTFYHILGKSVY